VVGGGAAGMEAAHILAADGHDLTLWEATGELGGVLRVAARTDAQLDRYLSWLLRRVTTSGATVVSDRLATAPDIAAAGYEEVIIATGGAMPVIDLDTTGERVSVRGGDTPGVRIAGFFAGQGKTVELVEPTGVFGQSLGLPGRWRLVPDLDAAGVSLVTEPALAADTIIDTTRRQPDLTLADELREAGVPVTFVGDANPDGVGRIEGANIDVARLASRLRNDTRV
jgi:2,4-dienoyl-CoA reductase (NADPH2)